MDRDYCVCVGENDIMQSESVMLVQCRRDRTRRFSAIKYDMLYDTYPMVFCQMADVLSAPLVDIRLLCGILGGPMVNEVCG
jgi:hypothetical protein